MNDHTNNRKLWGGRFEDVPSAVTEEISQSISFDSRLYRQDIRGSIAHTRMLQKCGILSSEDRDKIIDGLNAIEKEIDDGTFTFSVSREDIHMNIEARLTEMIGDPGRRLHTARSRNDQIALDLRLYVRDQAMEIRKLQVRLALLCADLANTHIDVIMPGYTHMQIAQPVRFSQHLLAYAWALVRDIRRLDFAFHSADQLPLGVGALAGVNYANDRQFLRDELGFGGITPNSMDTVSDRDFVIDFLYAAAVCGMHLSRFCEELVLWSTAEFNFIRLSDSVTTGSSIMPQKRNPDIAELIRGKSGRLYGNLIALLTVMKGLPLTYNRDLQEDKEPLFDSIDTILLSLRGMIEMLSTIQIKPDSMKRSLYANFSTATDIADYLAHKGVPFRDAHEITGKIVNHCEKNRIDFFTLSADYLKTVSPHFDDDCTTIIDPEQSPERKISYGGTSRASIQEQIVSIRRELETANLSGVKTEK